MAEPVDAPIDVRTRFERFPATVKGAFVLRGADGNPHGVSLVEAAVARVPTGLSLPVPLEDVVVDVAPGRDLFVPFEAPVSELEAGWYVVRSDFRVDAGRTWQFASRPFAVPWGPRENRRGTIRLDRPLTSGSREVVVDRIELSVDHATVVWRTAPPGDDPEPDGEAWLAVDGRPLEAVPGAEGRTGTERRTVFYPVPRPAVSAAVSVRAPGGARSEPLEVPLP